MIRKSLIILAALAFGLSVGASQTGCFGSDGPTLSVMGITPDVNAINVLTGNAIKVTFDQAIIETSVTAETFYVADANGNRVEGTFAFDSWVSLVFTPSTPLAEATVYTATVTTGVKAQYKDEELSLTENYTWNFTTQKWFAVGDQVSSTGAAADPVMMILNDPPSTVIKAESLTYTPAVGNRLNEVEMNLHFWSGSAWSATIPDPTGGLSDTFNHTPAYWTDGNVVNMATMLSTSPESVWVYQWDPTNDWRTLNTNAKLSGTENATEPVPACRPSGGDVFVAWLELVSDTVEIYVASVGLNTINKSGPLSRNSNAGDWLTDAEAVGIAADDTNAYLAFWEQHHLEDNRIDLYVTMWDTAAFTNLGDVVASDLYGGTDLRMPSVLVDGGNVYVAYALADADGVRKIHVQMWDGASWSQLGSPITAVSADSTANHPDLVMAGDTLYVAWDEASDVVTGNGVFAAFWDEASNTWVINDFNSALQQVLNTDARTVAYAYDPSLAYSSVDDMIYMAFEATTGGEDVIFTIRRSR